MKNISLHLTQAQFRDGSKTVTRRLAWGTLKPGDRLMACEKCQGIKRGEKVVRMGEIEVLSVRIEPLLRMINEGIYGRREAKLEGFPEMTGMQFVAMFCGHMKCLPQQLVTRIEFKHVNAIGHGPQERNDHE
ncbi:MAG: ASCH domain-containing protein [Luteolibacter sp.]